MFAPTTDQGGMAAPTSKAKSGGEWETERDEALLQAEKLQVAPRTRGNRKALTKQTGIVDDSNDKLFAQYLRWDRSGGCVIRRGF